MLCLDVYIANLLREGFSCIEQIIDITWEDLEDIGIHKLGIALLFMLTCRSVYFNNNNNKMTIHRAQ